MPAAIILPLEKKKKFNYTLKATNTKLSKFGRVELLILLKTEKKLSNIKKDL